jgi:N-methylhydantoinase A
VIDVANAVIAKALRVVSVERGHDPAGFTLVAFGGAGPLHACELAEALSIPRVLIPPYPGLMSAIGMTRADTVRDYAKPLLAAHPAAGDLRELTTLLYDSMMGLDAGARHDLGGHPEAEFAVDMRYQGQGHELNVPWDARNPTQLLDAFHALHHQRYGHSDPTRTVELITLRLRARVRRPATLLAAVEPGDEDASAARRGSRDVHLARTREVPLYSRERLRAGNIIHGPAIVEQLDSTTLILEGWYATVEPSGTLVLSRERHGS